MDLRRHPLMGRRSTNGHPSNRLPTGMLPFQPPSNHPANHHSNGLPTTFQGGVYQPPYNPSSKP